MEQLCNIDRAHYRHPFTDHADLDASAGPLIIERAKGSHVWDTDGNRYLDALAALVPTPRVDLTRFHGVVAPNSRYRARVTPGKRGRGGRHATTTDPHEAKPAERRAAMTPDQVRGKLCPACGGAMRIIACIEDPEVIEKILTYLNAKGAESEATWRPPSRAPPQGGLFDKTG
jgi:hypothetical protein